MIQSVNDLLELLRTLPDDKSILNLIDKEDNLEEMFYERMESG